MIFVVKMVEAQNFNYTSSNIRSSHTPSINFYNPAKASISKTFNQPCHKSYTPKIATINPLLRLKPLSCPVIAADYYTRGFGFFCKKELQFEKITKIPLTFRLGSLQYNNYLEGKPNSGILPSY